MRASATHFGDTDTNKFTIDTESVINRDDGDTLMSPVPGKYSPYLWKETVMTRLVQ